VQLLVSCSLGELGVGGCGGGGEGGGGGGGGCRGGDVEAGLIEVKDGKVGTRNEAAAAASCWIERGRERRGGGGASMSSALKWTDGDSPGSTGSARLRRRPEYGVLRLLRLPLALPSLPAQAGMLMKKRLLAECRADGEGTCCSCSCDCCPSGGCRC
jgi:hypothetical protein